MLTSVFFSIRLMLDVFQRRLVQAVSERNFKKAQCSEKNPVQLPGTSRFQTWASKFLRPLAQWASTLVNQ